MKALVEKAKNLSKYIKSHGLAATTELVKERLLSLQKDYTSEQRLIDVQNQINCELDNKRSTLIWTTHKCASTFVSRFLAAVDGVDGYRHFDYAGSIYRLGNKLNLENPYLIERRGGNLLFRPYGEIYGPLRSPIEIPNRENFVNIFFLRDPRDVLVSAYYSFAYSHSIPKHDQSRSRLLEMRERVLSSTIDDYCLREADNWIIPYYRQYEEYRESSPDSYFFSYDEYRMDPETFIENIFKKSGFYSFEKKLVRVLAARAKPVQNDPEKRKHLHKRSGFSGQFETTLSTKTVNLLNEKLSLILRYWGFKV
jgi:hypothetical protein